MMNESGMKDGSRVEVAKKEIPEQIVRIEVLTETIGKFISDLTSRLAPISQSNPSAIQDKSVEEGAQTEMGENLRMIGSRLELHKESLVSLIDELEI